jgi:hypothetical protein
MLTSNASVDEWQNSTDKWLRKERTMGHSSHVGSPVSRRLGHVSFFVRVEDEGRSKMSCWGWQSLEVADRTEVSLETRYFSMPATLRAMKSTLRAQADLRTRDRFHAHLWIESPAEPSDAAEKSSDPKNVHEDKTTKLRPL